MITSDADGVVFLPQTPDEPWNPNRWASCPEVVDPRLQSGAASRAAQFYVGTSPSGRSIDDEEQYKTYLYYILNTTRSASSELRFLEMFQEAQDNIRALRHNESNSTLDVKSLDTTTSRSSWSSSLDIARGTEKTLQPSITPAELSSSVAEVGRVKEHGVSRKARSLGEHDATPLERRNLHRCEYHGTLLGGSCEVTHLGNETYSKPVRFEHSYDGVPTLSEAVQAQAIRYGSSTSGCEAYDNPCFETKGSPQCSYTNVAQRNGVVGQCAIDSQIRLEDSKYSPFPFLRVSDFLRYVFCCDCCVWDTSEAKRPSEVS